MSTFSVVSLLVRIGQQPFARRFCTTFAVRHLRLPDELRDRLAAEIFRFVRILDAVRLPLDARELHRSLDRVGRRRTVGPHRDKLKRQRLALTHRHRACGMMPR